MSTKNIAFYFIFSLTIFFYLTTQANDSGLFGIELTYTSDDLERGALFQDKPTDLRPLNYQRLWDQTLRRRFMRLPYSAQDPFHFMFAEENSMANSVQYSVYPNINSRIRVNILPAKLKVIEDKQNFISFNILTMAQKVGLTNLTSQSGTALEIDIDSNFKNNPLLLRNFIVDLFNHPEIFMGAIKNHQDSQWPLLSMHGQSLLNSVELAVLNYDENPQDIDKLFNDINQSYKNHGLNERDQAISLRPKQGVIRINDLFAPQTDASNITDLVRFFSTRIEFLSKYRHPILFSAKNYSLVSEGRLFENLPLVGNETQSQFIARKYFDFLKATDLQPGTYQSYILDEQVKVAFGDLIKQKTQPAICQKVISSQKP